jgi:hypothetical protein
MNTGALVGIMLACGILIGMLPATCFTLASILFQLPITWTVLLITFAIILVLTFGVLLGAFAFLQYDNCKKVNMKQVATNAGIATGIQAGALLLSLIPGVLGIPMSVIPSWIVYPMIREGIGYGYYVFFATMFGTVIGGTFSSIC